MLKPLVSIIINNHNYERFVGDAISSALHQTYDRIEVIVVDDGSTDNSRAVIEGYGKQIVTVFKANEGQSSTFNAGFARSSGEIICFLDADDLFLPNKVEEIVEGYTDEATGWCFHPLQWVDAIARPISGSPDSRYETGLYDLRRQYLRGKPTFSAPATSGLTFKRALLKKMVPLPQLPIGSDQYLTFSTPAFAPGFYLSERLSFQRIHGANAYTAKEDPLSKAALQMSVARGMHDALPEIKRIADRLFANAVAAMWTGGADLADFSGEFRQYLGSCGVPEKVEVLARTAYRILRPRRPRVPAPAQPGIRPAIVR